MSLAETFCTELSFMEAKMSLQGVQGVRRLTIFDLYTRVFVFGRAAEEKA